MDYMCVPCHIISLVLPLSSLQTCLFFLKVMKHQAFQSCEIQLLELHGEAQDCAFPPPKKSPYTQNCAICFIRVRSSSSFSFLFILSSTSSVSKCLAFHKGCGVLPQLFLFQLISDRQDKHPFPGAEPTWDNGTSRQKEEKCPYNCQETLEIHLKCQKNYEGMGIILKIFFIPFFSGPSSFLFARGNIPNRIFHSRNISLYLSLIRSPPQVHMSPDTTTTPFSCISLQIMSQSAYFLQYGRTKDETREDLRIGLF